MDTTVRPLQETAVQIQLDRTYPNRYNPQLRPALQACQRQETRCQPQKLGTKEIRPNETNKTHKTHEANKPNEPNKANKANKANEANETHQKIRTNNAQQPT